MHYLPTAQYSHVWYDNVLHKQLTARSAEIFYQSTKSSWYIFKKVRPFCMVLYNILYNIQICRVFKNREIREVGQNRFYFKFWCSRTCLNSPQNDLSIHKFLALKTGSWILSRSNFAFWSTKIISKPRILCIGRILHSGAQKWFQKREICNPSLQIQLNIATMSASLNKIPLEKR